ncbi:epsin-3-like [Lotus japonicus]|uniref:epsin-3-like n=1 Tax=Lotus japonicus TaxID=34305 RepID=UPI002587FD0F|nr:epsin-3-like [Lotus japonicus]
MSSPLIHEIKGQTFRFLKEKIKTARLVLTDVTPVQLMTEEATSENPWPPDTSTMRIISHAAFEVDEYERIVHILHHRLSKFDKGSWRASYKTLILLEHVLTHGPKRVFEEFQCDHINVIEEIGKLQYVDEKGVNWGLCVRTLSQRMLKLLGNKDFLKEERERARNLSHAIQGFGSFSQGSSSSAINERLHDTSSKKYGRCKSDYGDHHHHEQYDDFTSLEKKLVSEDGNKRMAKQHVFGNENFKLLKQENDSNSGIRRRHRRTIALDQENQLTTISLLSVK